MSYRSKWWAVPTPLNLLSGKLEDCAYSPEKIEEAIAELPVVE